MGRRLDVKVGWSCNNNCIFCAQAHKRYLGDLTTEEIKQKIFEGRMNGCDEIVLTGGEPTIRKDIFELVSYARDLKFKIIQIQTNGRMFYYRGFVEKIIDAGANEFSPSIHGHNKLIHEMQTRAKGSFEQTFEGIKNLKEMGQYVITNTVITKINYKFLPQIAEMLVNLNVDQFQFAFVHPIGNAYKNFELVVPRKSEVMEFVHKALKIAIDAGYKPGQVMVEAYPFCFMKGFELFCSELYIPPSQVVEKNLKIERFEEWRKRSGKTKFEKCAKCRFNLICEGPWREYPEKYGEEEFVPVSGPPIHSAEELLSEHETKFRRITLNEL